MSKKTIIIISVLFVAANVTFILTNEYVVINLICLLINVFNIGFTMASSAINKEMMGKVDVVSNYLNENLVLLDEMPGVDDMHKYITCSGETTDDGSMIWICIKDNTQELN